MVKRAVYPACVLPAPKTFRLDVDDRGVATLTLNRPDALNALTFDTYRELHEVARALADLPQARALVITGAGRGFCSGGHVREIIGVLVDADRERLHAFARLANDVVLALRQLGKPVIAAVNGIAVGGGAALALAADIRLASPEAQIGFVFPKVGLSSAEMGVTWLLPRVVGLGRASELLLTGDIIGAEQAHAMGLFNHIVASDRLLEEAQALAARLAAGPTRAVALTKEMLDREATLDLPTALAAETVAQVECLAGADFRAAHAANMAKRPPAFKR